MDADFGVERAVLDFDTSNHLYGAQVGADARVFDNGCFALDALGKVGIYGNSNDQDFVLAQTNGPPFAARGAGTQEAFVGEAAVTGVYQWTDCLALRAGYQLLWIEGAALASDQVNSIDVINSTGLNSTGSVFYHGATLGAEFIW